MAGAHRMLDVIVALLFVVLYTGNWNQCLTLELQGVIRGNVTLNKTSSPYTVPYDLTVESDAVLRIDPGVRIQFAPSVGIFIRGGTLEASGTAQQKIVFERLPDRTYESKFTDKNVRLMKGTKNNTGFVEVRWKNEWYTICDNRKISDADFSLWAQPVASAVCRSVGYIGVGELSFQKQPASSRSLRGIQCNEIKTQQFSRRCKVDFLKACDPESTIFVKCHGEEVARNWQGMKIAAKYEMMPNTSYKRSFSRLNHVIIDSAGANRNLETSDALEINLATVAISNIEIYNSAGRNLVMNKMTSPVTLRNIKIVSPGSENGIRIQTAVQSVTIDNANVTGTVNNGIEIMGYEATLEAHSFCNAFYSFGSYPLMFKFSKEYYQRMRARTCQRVFHTNPNQRLKIMFISNFSLIHVEVRDGDSQGAPLLYKQTDITLVTPPPVITSGNSVWIWLLAPPYVDAHELVLIVYSVSGEEVAGFSDGLTMKGVSCTDNKNTGIAIRDFFGDVHLSNMNIANSETCITVIGGAGRLGVENSIFKDAKFGLRVNSRYGDVKNYGVDIDNCVKEGLTFSLKNECDTSLEMTQNHVQLEQVTVQGSDQAISVKNHRCRMEVVVLNCTLKNNRIGAYFSDKNSVSNVSKITVNNSKFENNSLFSLKGEISTGVNVHIEKNSFIENNGTVVDLKINSVVNGLAMNITENVFTDNTGSRVLYFVGSGSVSLTHNTFLHNRSPVSQLRSNMCGSSPSVTSVVKSALLGKVIMQYNIFENPSFLYELALEGTHSYGITNATYNFWGSRNFRKIRKRILGHHTSYSLPKVELQPFYSDRNLKYPKSSKLKWSIHDFKDGNCIGGSLQGDVTLSSTDSPFVVKSDIIIRKSATLTIQKGVQLLFKSGTGILVYGELRIAGNLDSPVVLSSHSVTSSNKVFRFRTIHNSLDNTGMKDKGVQFKTHRPIDTQFKTSKESEGFVEYKINGTFVPLYSSSEMIIPEADTMCKALGFESSSQSLHRKKRYILSPMQHKGTRHVPYCFSRIICDPHGAASFEGCYLSRCNNSEETCYCNPVYLKCALPAWKGITFAKAASSSTLEHVVVAGAGQTEQYGHKSSIVVDYFRHTFRNVSIYVGGSATAALLIDKINTAHHEPISGLHIHMLKTPDTSVINIFQRSRTALVTHDSRLQISNATLTTDDMNSVGLEISPSLPEYNISDQLLTEACSLSVIRLSDSPVFLRFPEVDSRKKTFRNGPRNTGCPVKLIAKPGWKCLLQIVRFDKPGRKRCTHVSLDYQKRENIGEPVVVVASSPGWSAISSLSDMVIVKSNVQMDCEIILKVSAVSDFASPLDISQGFIKRSYFENFDIAISVKSYAPPSAFFVSDTTIISRTGLVAIGGSDVHVHSSSFTCSRSGLKFRGRGLHVNKTRFHGKGINLYIGNDIESRVQLASTTFIGDGLSNGENALDITVANTYNLSVKVSQCTITNYTRAIEITRVKTAEHRRMTESQVQVHITGNKFENNMLGIYDNENDQLPTSNISWNITKNTFVGMQGTPVSVSSGHGNISFNILKDNTVLNVNSSLIYIKHSTDNTLFIEYNEISSNIVGNKVVVLSGQSKNSKINFRHNAIFSNKLIKEVECRNEGSMFSTAVLIEGQYMPGVVYNMFSNEDIKYELAIHLHSVDVFHVNASLNYWGTEDYSSISKRIYDGRSESFLAVCDYIPFYTSSGLDSVSYGLDHKDETVLLDGVIKEDVILTLKDSPVQVKNDLYILKTGTLRIEPGVKIEIGEGKQIIVRGIVEAIGNAESPIVFDVMIGTETSSGCLGDNDYGVKLVDDTNSDRGTLYIKIDDEWMGAMLDNSNPTHAATLACKGAGFERGFVKISYDDKLQNHSSTLLFVSCLGNETKLSDCLVTPQQSNLPPVKITCLHSSHWGGLLFLNNDNKMPKSELKHVHILHTGLVQKKLTPSVRIKGIIPTMSDLLVQTSLSSAIFIYRNSMPTRLEKISVEDVSESGIVLLEPRSEVTLSRIRMQKIKTNGISVISGDISSYANQALGDFLFCDVTGEMTIQPGTTKYFYASQSSRRRDCQLKMSTDKNHLIFISLSVGGQGANSVTFTETNHDPVKVIGPNIKFISRTSSVDVILHCKENDVAWAQVKTLKSTNLPCKFDEGTCGWNPVLNSTHNVWNLYSGQLDPTLFNGLHYGGNYIFCAQTNQRQRSPTECNVDSPSLNAQTNACEISFQYFLRFSTGTGDMLALYLNADGQTEEIWRTAKASGFDWSSHSVSIEALSRNLKTPFTLTFRAYLTAGSKKSAGLKNIHIKSCAMSSDSLRVLIKDSQITDVGQNAVHIQSTSKEYKIFDINLSTSSISMRPTSRISNAVYIEVRHANISVSNCHLSRATGDAVKIVGKSNSIGLNDKWNIIGNTITQCNTAIQVIGNKVYRPNILLEKNSIYNNKGSSDGLLLMSQVESSITRNLVWRNEGLYLMKLLCSVRCRKQQVTDNTFAFNTIHSGSAISVNSPNTNFSRNIFVNPGIKYEIRLESVKPPFIPVYALWNWWGTDSVLQLRRKIRIPYHTARAPYVHCESNLDKPPAAFRYISHRCPLGWSAVSDNCFIFKSGARGYREAHNDCTRMGGAMLSAEFISSNNSKAVFSIFSEMGYMRKDSLSVWILSEDSGTGCNVFSADSVSSAHVEKRECWIPHAYICKSTIVSRCPNNCFNRGRCIGDKCICQDGYHGNDCSLFNCDRLNNCSRHGQCVGANFCECIPGWQGKACTVSPCTSKYDCRQCTQVRGCGWCDDDKTHSRCFPGTQRGPTVNECKHWFYRHCLSTGQKCSRHITHLPLSSKYCKDTTLSPNEREQCTRSKDVEQCFYQPSRRQCTVWNSTKCPTGIQQSDYDDPQRIHKTIVYPNVKIVSEREFLLYTCPVQSEGMATEQDAVVILGEGKMEMNKDDVLVSEQAGGIFHQITGSVSLGQYTLLHVNPAVIDDVIAFADFEQTVDMSVMGDPLSEEIIPDQQLLSHVMTSRSDSLTLNVHKITTENVYKCVGSWYSTGDGRFEASYFIVMEARNVKKYKVGEIIASNKSAGFLEQITGFSDTVNGRIMRTKLHRCSFEEKLLDRINVITESETILSCVGGDNMKGLYLLKPREAADLQVEDIIVGRKSGSFLGQITRKIKHNGLAFFELIPVVGVTERSLVGSMQMSDVTTVKARTGQSSDEALPSFQEMKLITVFHENDRAARVKCFVNTTCSFKIHLSLHFSSNDPHVRKTGMTLINRCDVNMDASMDIYAASYSHSLSRRISAKPPKRFVVKIGDLPVPGVLLFSTNLQFDMSGQAKTSLSIGMDARGDTESGFMWKEARGWTKRRSNHQTSSSLRFDGSILRKTPRRSQLQSDFCLRVTPGVRFQWPAISSPRVAIGQLQLLPKTMTEFIGNSRRKLQSSLVTISQQLPFFSNITASSCSRACHVPGKTSELSAAGGLQKVAVKVNLKIGKYFDKNVSISEEFPHSTTFERKCMDQNSPCCFCEDGEEGIIDDGECYCPCKCDENTPGRRRSGDKICQCKICPDGQTFMKKTGYLQCPCACPDGSLSEQKLDGPCDCACRCPDGSAAVLGHNGCPCECQCQNCDYSELGVNGCVCPNDVCPPCNGETRWVNCECICVEEITCGIATFCTDMRKGPKCDIPICPSCKGCKNHGYCGVDKGTCGSRCFCDDGYEGECCEKRKDGQFSRALRSVPDLYTQCFDGSSSACQGFTCDNVQLCSGHGTCVGTNLCVCNDGWTGTSCAIPDCGLLDHCSGNGACVKTQKCKCYNGYTGRDCSQPLQCPRLNNCNNNGLCIINKNKRFCSCHHGFGGRQCEQISCQMLDSCNDHGQCVEPDLCSCSAGYMGDKCEIPACDAMKHCSGNGRCEGLNTCICNQGWRGKRCDIALCEAVNNCSGQGECKLPNQCECYTGFEGSQCERAMPNNEHSPVITGLPLSISTSSLTPVGSIIFKVNVFDLDSGQNGVITYSLISTTHSEYLTIDSKSGSVSVLRNLSPRDVGGNFMAATVVARDSGFPPKSAIAALSVTIVDHDDCTLFIDSSKENIYVKDTSSKGSYVTRVTAADHEKISEGIEYSLAADLSSGLFQIDPSSGVIRLARSGVPTGRYMLRVVAKKTNPVFCSISQELPIYVMSYAALKSGQGDSRLREEIIKEIDKAPPADVTNAQTTATPRIPDQSPIGFYHLLWIVIPVAVIVLILIISVVLIIIFRQKRGRDKKFSAVPVRPPNENHEMAYL